MRPQSCSSAARCAPSFSAPFFSLRDKNDHLPRLARDKHKEHCITKQWVLFPQGTKTADEQRFVWKADASTGAENILCLSHFILKMIILPRQARDKCRESTQKELRFTQATERSPSRRGNSDRRNASASRARRCRMMMQQIQQQQQQIQQQHSSL
jgi:hypothetical protein